MPKYFQKDTEPGVVIAIDDTAVAFEGDVIAVHRGQAWAAEDPFVQQFPQLFSTQGGRLVRRTRPYVEQATANPGERR